MEEEGKDRRMDEKRRDACRTYTDTLLVIASSEKQLKQATLDLDSMVGDLLYVILSTDF